MKLDFENKHVLITGAGSGIGRATAIAFARAGASLELVDIASGGLEEPAASCRELGRRVHTHVCDVADAGAMASLAQRVHARIAALDVLMNNAGVGVAGDFVGTELAVWDWAIGINVKGVIHGCHYFVPKMVERAQGGHVINVASAAGLVAPKNMSVYATTKFAVVGLSEALRLELGDHKIGVTTLCPGVINTPITRSARLTGKLAHQVGLQDRIAKLYERRNYGPERVASAVLDAVRKRKKVVPVAPEAWAMYYGKRLSPALMDMLMDRDAPG
jgi:NAD(P)-dependent dehydrogenase (short-subunit alcohol dehydrogenase family)